MKTTSKLAAFLLACCMLGGCGSSTNTIATLNSDYSITADQAYEELMKTSQGKSAAFTFMVKEIITANYPETDAMTTDANIVIEQLQNQYTSYYGADADTQLLNALQSSGYESLDKYREAIIYSYQMQEFLTDYIKENKDEIFNDYYTTCKPRYVSHILVLMEDSANPTDEELAKVQAIQKALDEGKDFAQVAKEYSDDSTASKGGELGLCDKNTSFVTEFLNKMLELEEGQVSEPTKTDYGYHFIKVTSTAKEDMTKDEDALMNLLMSYDESIVYKALRNYDITFNDETLKELYEKTLDSYIQEGSAN